MTLNCEKINLKKGSKGDEVKELQTLLQKKGFYNGIIDGDYGQLTKTAVTKYQKQTGTLLADGVCGPVTCKHLNKNIQSSQTTNKEYTIFTNTKLCTRCGGNCLGQSTGYSCAGHCILQCVRRFGITGYSEKKIGQYAGTTTAGTSHQGIETAIAKIAQNEGIKLRVTWKNFSDLGSNEKERYKKYGDLMTDPDKAVFHHELYRDQYGHYSVLRQVNTNNNSLVVANSLGNRCSYPAYCGYMENRSFNTQTRYLRGISQKSICIITKEA